MAVMADTDIQDAMKQAASGAAEILRGLSNADRLLSQPVRGGVIY